MSDAVGLGLFAGGVGGVLIILGGAVYAAARDKLPNGEFGDYSFKYFTYGNGVFWWLVLLTAAVAGARNTIDKAYEVDKLSEYLDWFNLMTYDLHGI